jgi:uncharacterized protein YndB with AHSA1/START domain
VRVEASRELPAPRGDVWAFLAEPYHFSDWWPGVAGVRPDRRGFAAGARWEVSTAPQPTLLRRGSSETLLLVRAVDRPRSAAWHLTAERLDVDVTLEATAPERTRVTVGVSAPLVLGPRRLIARQAVNRLYDLCQTAATL